MLHCTKGQVRKGNNDRALYIHNTMRFASTFECLVWLSYRQAGGGMTALLMNMRLLLADPLVALANAIAPPEVKEQVRRRERG
jgi:hypothetical protein